MLDFDGLLDELVDKIGESAESVAVEILKGCSELTIGRLKDKKQTKEIMKQIKGLEKKDDTDFQIFWDRNFNEIDELRSCHLCPRECGTDRYNSKGFCDAPAQPVIARAALHMWEEPCISGQEGSGAVFFSGCPVKCVYCQNYSIADCTRGKQVTDDRLSEIFLELQHKKANNINLVTPTHYTYSIIHAVRKARKNGLTIPVVYNCSGYEKVETLKLLEGTVDIYLTDFKYFESDTAKRYSRAADYPQIVKNAVDCMYRQVGTPVFDDNQMMKKGVIVRHLMLPGYEEESEKIIRYLYETYGDNIFLSIMNQYTPLGNVSGFREIDRKVTSAEYDRVIDFACDLGVENAFVQDGPTASESFIPEFNGEGV